MSPNTVSLRRAVKAITSNDPVFNENEFLEILADRLMLDEVLCGGANPREFLREEMRQAELIVKRNRVSDRLNYIEGEIQGDYK